MPTLYCCAVGLAEKLGLTAELGAELGTVEELGQEAELAWGWRGVVTGTGARAEGRAALGGAPSLPSVGAGPGPAMHPQTFLITPLGACTP